MTIRNYEKFNWCLPLRDGGITKPFKQNSHIGVDIGWVKDIYTNIYPIQDGKIVDIFYSATCGYSVVVQHDYSDGTHRWSAYIHLKNSAANYVKVGDSVKQAYTVLGLRGNTGASYGVHLHVYVTDTTTKTYSWELLKSLCTFDPLPYFYLTKKFTYSLATEDGYNLGEIPYIEDINIKYPTPVERDAAKHQVDIDHPNKWLRLRANPNGDIYDEYCTNGIYDVLDAEISGNYKWYKIAEIDGNEFWVAFSDSWATDLPVYNPQDIIDKLEKKVAELSDSVTSLNKQLVESKSALDVANTKIANAINELN